MSETINSMSLKDMREFERLFKKHGYTIVNDYEMPDDDNDWGFDITGNEVMQPQKYSANDMEDIEKYLNGSGYSVVRISSLENEEVQQSETQLRPLEKYMAEMALIRTCASTLALLISIVIAYKVW